jgi:hypothetical protein
MRFNGSCRTANRSLGLRCPHSRKAPPTQPVRLKPSAPALRPPQISQNGKELFKLNWIFYRVLDWPSQKKTERKNEGSSVERDGRAILTGRKMTCGLVDRCLGWNNVGNEGVSWCSLQKDDRQHAGWKERFATANAGSHTILARTCADDMFFRSTFPRLVAPTARARTARSTPSTRSLSTRPAR